jgi:hypothetical protein
MNTTDSASARMEANIMKYLNGPSMGTSKQAKPARKVVFLVGPDEDDQEADEVVEIGKRYDTVSASVLGKMSLFMSMYDVDPDQMPADAIAQTAVVSETQKPVQTLAEDRVSEFTKESLDTFGLEKNWIEFQEAMKGIRAKKTAEVAARATRMAVAEAEDDEDFARKQGQELEDEYEFVNEVDVVENFEEIDKRDAVEKYVVVEFTEAR